MLNKLFSKNQLPVIEMKYVDNFLAQLEEYHTSKYVTLKFHERHLKENKDYYEDKIKKLEEYYKPKSPMYDIPMIEKAIEQARYYYNEDERNHLWAKHLLRVAGDMIKIPKPLEPIDEKGKERINE
jgi:hypothetical protein